MSSDIHDWTPAGGQDQYKVVFPIVDGDAKVLAEIAAWLERDGVEGQTTPQSIELWCPSDEADGEVRFWFGADKPWDPVVPNGASRFEKWPDFRPDTTEEEQWEGGELTQKGYDLLMPEDPFK